MIETNTSGKPGLDFGRFYITQHPPSRLEGHKGDDETDCCDPLGFALHVVNYHRRDTYRQGNCPYPEPHGTRRIQPLRIRTVSTPSSSQVLRSRTGVVRRGTDDLWIIVQMRDNIDRQKRPSSLTVELVHSRSRGCRFRHWDMVVYCWWVGIC